MLVDAAAWENYSRVQEHDLSVFQSFFNFSAITDFVPFAGIQLMNKPMERTLETDGITEANVSVVSRIKQVTGRLV